MENVKGILSAKVGQKAIFNQILADLRAAGGSPGSYYLIPVVRPVEGADNASEKDRVRSGLIVARDEQLREQSVRDFISAMEQPRLHQGKWVSISSLVRDGV